MLSVIPASTAAEKWERIASTNIWMRSAQMQLATGTILGRWCDVMVPGNQRLRRETTIVTTDNGLVARTKFFDGSRQTLRLKEQGSVMLVVGSGSGDAFRVSGGTGDLQLLDRDGLIRIARRLENARQPGDCVQ